MIGSLTDHWKYMQSDVWSVLARSRRAPPDLFIELYRTATDFLQHEPDYKQFEIATNDPVQARTIFEQIRAQDFGSELSIIRFLESAFETIEEFEIPRSEKLYRYLMRLFIQKYNLRYRIDDPFRIRLVLPGVFAGLYEDLRHTSSSDEHLAELMSNFELAFATYVRTNDRPALNAAIMNAFIYAEGLAAKTAGKHKTLGELCKLLKSWPHATVRNSLITLYGFRNDYPGLGHPGNRDGKIRNLEPRDAIVVCLLLLSFAGYLTNDVKMDQLLEK